MIIKQLTEVVKTTVNPISTLVTYNENSKDKTTQNGDNVIDKTIENNNKELFKNKKSTNKNLANTKTLSITDNFTSKCFEHTKNKKNASANGKNTSGTNEKKKHNKKISTIRLQIGTTATRIEIIKIKRMFLFLATVW